MMGIESRVPIQKTFTPEKQQTELESENESLLDHEIFDDIIEYFSISSD